MGDHINFENKLLTYLPAKQPKINCLKSAKKQKIVDQCPIFKVLELTRHCKDVKYWYLKLCISCSRLLIINNYIQLLLGLQGDQIYLNNLVQCFSIFFVPWAISKGHKCLWHTFIRTLIQQLQCHGLSLGYHGSEVVLRRRKVVAFQVLRMAST